MSNPTWVNRIRTRLDRLRRYASGQSAHRLLAQKHQNERACKGNQGSCDAGAKLSLSKGEVSHEYRNDSSRAFDAQHIGGQSQRKRFHLKHEHAREEQPMKHESPTAQPSKSQSEPS